MKSELSPSHAPVDPFKLFKRRVRSEQWLAALSLYAEVARTHAPDPGATLLYHVACSRSSELRVLPEEVSQPLVIASDGRVDIRRLVVTPWMRQGWLVEVVPVLRLLLASFPEQVEDRRTLASVLGRLKRWDEAIAEADQVAARQPADGSAHAARIRLRLQCGRLAEAEVVARETEHMALASPAHCHAWIDAFVRCEDIGSAVRIAQSVDPAALGDARAATSVLQAFSLDGRTQAAIAFGDEAIKQGLDNAALRRSLAQAHLASADGARQTAWAIKHLKAAVRMSPEDMRSNALYGETLLRSGKAEKALPYLEKSVRLAPGLAHLRSMYARSLLQLGQPSAAADQYLHLLNVDTGSTRWHRLAVAGLTRSARHDEAKQIFDAYVAHRMSSLPDDLETGLHRLWQQLDAAQIPQARLDWAWSLRDKTLTQERGPWERAARWGCLADRLLMDWLECREGRAAEAMSLLAELDVTERALSAAMSSGKGLLVATAHIGPLYAGPMVLELLGIPSRWLASTPGVAQASYAGNLISTSDQPEKNVAKACLQALQAGEAVCLAVDGAASVAAPRIAFEGQQITYSSFAARVAYRTGAASIFCAPCWVDGRIDFLIEPLPTPVGDEDNAAYAGRWRKAYLGCLRTALRGKPENLRMSGGIWRHITSDGSA